MHLYTNRFLKKIARIIFINDADFNMNRIYITKIKIFLNASEVAGVAQLG